MPDQTLYNNCRSEMKGQGNIVEYALLVFFIVIIIFVLIVFITGFQLFQIDTEAQKQSLDRTLSLSKQFMVSGYFTNKDSVFDDAKLTAATGLACSDFEKTFGSSWFLEVRTLDNKSQKECSMENYPDCNYWKICVKNNPKNISYIFPVNVFSKTDDMVSLASLKVGIYR